MGRASRRTWARRRTALLSLPGSLGTMVRSWLLLGEPTRGILADGRESKDSALRSAWWLRDQHLAGGKFRRQYTQTVTDVDHESKTVTINAEPNYPQFPSVAAMLKHFKEEETLPRGES
jgi:hypothetical protein